MKKKIGALFLSLSILFGCIPAGAAEANHTAVPIEGDTLVLLRGKAM